MRDNGSWDLGHNSGNQEVRCRFSGRWDMGCEISRGIRTGLDYGLNNGKDAFAITCVERCMGGTEILAGGNVLRVLRFHCLAVM